MPSQTRNPSGIAAATHFGTLGVNTGTVTQTSPAYAIGGTAIAEAAIGGGFTPPRATVPGFVSVSGIASTVTFGPLHTREYVRPAGITSRSLLGVIGGQSNQYRPPGIASTLIFGQPVASRIVTRGVVGVPTGLASTVRFGIAAAWLGVPGHVTARGIASTARFGLANTYTPPVAPTPYTLWQLLNYCSPAASMQETPRLISIKFGDGYAQTFGDGLSSIDRTLTVSWDSLDTSQADLIASVLRGWSGYALSFVAPRERSPRKWLVKSWDRQNIANGIDAMTATFEERLYEGPLA